VTDLSISLLWNSGIFAVESGIAFSLAPLTFDMYEGSQIHCPLPMQCDTTAASRNKPSESAYPRLTMQ
jgi:hypothetical protein